METMVSGRMLRVELLLLPLLLCFGPETVGSINLTALSYIVNYVDRYGVKAAYAFAVSLNRTYCRNAAGLEQGLPEDELQSMHNATNQTGGLYDPHKGPIVAAQMKRLESGAGEHAEWRLLRGGQNSPVRKLLARTYNERSCLIFFTLLSPCAGTCLRENGPYNILRMVSDTFGPIDDNYKAFVFRQIYREDRENLDSQSLLQAWHRLHNVPLYRCFRKRCWDCSSKDPNINNCLSGM